MTLPALRSRLKDSARPAKPQLSKEDRALIRQIRPRSCVNPAVVFREKDRICSRWNHDRSGRLQEAPGVRAVVEPSQP